MPGKCAELSGQTLEFQNFMQAKPFKYSRAYPPGRLAPRRRSRFAQPIGSRAPIAGRSRPPDPLRHAVTGLTAEASVDSLRAVLRRNFLAPTRRIAQWARRQQSRYRHLICSKNWAVKRRDRWRPVMRRCSVPGLNNASPATWARDQIAKRIIKMAQTQRARPRPSRSGRP
jgi:hypothetical protein